MSLRYFSEIIMLNPSQFKLHNFAADFEMKLLNERHELAIKHLYLTFIIFVLRGFLHAKLSLKGENYEEVIPACTNEIESNGSFANEARVLRGTFYILSKQQNLAFGDLNTVIDDESADVRLRVNALIKRASLYIQQCKDPIKDPDMSFADFAKAEKIDPENTDIYHHRGQVRFSTCF